ncbi:hypothetical protein G9A89_016584 [Geosiphon pyriformis]|nr:hypothetical protein G9A89_016584 [Geosiphon pyriformis]
MELRFWKATETTIESLSIIQRTPQSNLQINKIFGSITLLTTDIKQDIEHQVMDIILQRTGTNNNYPKVAESEIIRTNHLEFAKSLFQQYSQQLGLINNHYPTESAFNFYINERITNLLGRPVDIESITASKEKEKENQKFNYQNLITENPEQIPNNPNSELINQKNLSPEIVINQQPIDLIAEQSQQPSILPQPLFFQPPQQPNIDPMAYASIAKLEKFTDEEDDTQVWLNNVKKAITANGWNDARNYLSFLVIPKDAKLSKEEPNQTQLLNNISPAIITKNKSLTAIFPFELKKPVKTPLFSEVTLKSKLITTIYTDVKVDETLAQSEQSIYISTGNLQTLQTQHTSTTNKIRRRRKEIYLGSLPSLMG